VTMEKVFVLVLLLPLSVTNYHSTRAPHSLIILGWYHRHISGRSTKTPSISLRQTKFFHKKKGMTRLILNPGMRSRLVNLTARLLWRRQKKLLPVPGIEPRFPDRPGSQVTVPTELSWLQYKIRETDILLQILPRKSIKRT